MTHASRITSSFLCAFGLALVYAGAFAQNYPSKNVTVVVPFPAGGPSDIAARPTAKGLSESLGKPFVVDNRPGAGGNIGADLVAKAAPDGHTLLISSSAPIVINPSLYKKMPFDPAKDLAPITNLIRVPLVLAAHPPVPAKGLQELIAHIKSQQGKFQYASAGNGSPQYLTAEMFKSVAKLDMIHVPYKVRRRRSRISSVGTLPSCLTVRSRSSRISKVASSKRLRSRARNAPLNSPMYPRSPKRVFQDSNRMPGMAFSRPLRRPRCLCL